VRVCATGHLEHNLEHWKLHIGFDSLSSNLDPTRGPCARPTIRVKTRTAGRSGPRSPRRRPARAGRGRDQSDGPSGRSGAVRAFFHVSANFTRSHVSALRCGLSPSSLSSLFQERGLPRNYRVAYARCSCEVSHDSSRRGSIGLRSLAAKTGAADKRGSFASLSVGTRWLCSACN
jgi:hypothetical protein